MSGDNLAAEAEAWRRLYGLPSRLGPVASLADALAKASAEWLACADCDAALVFATNRGDVWPAHVAQRGRAGRIATLAAVSLTPWPDNDVWMRFLGETGRQSSPHVVAFPLQSADAIVGAVVLAGSGELRIAPLVQDWLIQFTGVLIEQGRLVDAAVSAEQLERAKLESMAELAAGAGHEINNPLATISGRVQLLLKDEVDPERRSALLSIGAQAHRIRDMIGDLMLFGRPPEPVPAQLDAIEVVRQVAEAWQSRARTAGLQIRIAGEAPVPIWADRAQLSVAVGALVQNSVEACAAGGEIALDVSSGESHGEPIAVISVSDDGPGISPDIRAHLFDPFYSGRQAGRGLGFGLSKCWRIVSNHRGRIDVQPREPQGVAFRIEWPASALR